MKWFQGNIAEAVAKSKANGAIFVVYIEGTDENSKKLTAYLEEESIRTHLESENFVAIKVEGGSETYMQFASIYQVVPVPSIFFIGKTGTPLEIATGILGSASELLNKIDKVLSASGKPSATTISSTSSFIAAEQQATSSQVRPQAKETTTATAEAAATTTTTTEPDEEIVCEGGVCYKRKNESATAVEKKNVALASSVTNDDVEDKEKTDPRLEETRKRLEQKRRERVEEEKKQEKEHELRRRREGKEMQNLQSWQKEQELKELKENMKRERQEELAARERILAKIAADRAERAHKSSQLTAEQNSNSTNNNTAPPSPPVNNADTVRLQFRLSNGSNKSHIFDSQDTLSVVRAYIVSDLLPGTGIKDYILATNYPRREFTIEHDTQTLLQLDLAPSAVMLVIGKEGRSPVALIKRSGGIVNILSTLFWTLMSPVYAVFGYVRNMFGRGNMSATDASNASSLGAQKRANEEQGAQHDAAKRRNLDRLIGGPSTSRSPNNGEEASNFESNGTRKRFGGSNIHRLRDNRNDSDDENATWNGNSTQQQ